jgi:hypothetical protein
LLDVAGDGCRERVRLEAQELVESVALRRGIERQAKADRARERPAGRACRSASPLPTAGR